MPAARLISWNGWPPASLNNMHRGPATLIKPDDYKAKAEEYKRLAQACVDPEEKKKLEKLEQDCHDLALAAQ
jgi:hypothetical protein